MLRYFAMFIWGGGHTAFLAIENGLARRGGSRHIVNKFYEDFSFAVKIHPRDKHFHQKSIIIFLAKLLVTELLFAGNYVQNEVNFNFVTIIM